MSDQMDATAAAADAALQAVGGVSPRLELLSDARHADTPIRGSEYVCPSCENPIPTRKQIRLAKPAKYEDALNDVLKCPTCNFIFSPRNIATVVSR